MALYPIRSLSVLPRSSTIVLAENRTMICKFAQNFGDKLIPRNMPAIVDIFEIRLNFSTNSCSHSYLPCF